VTAAMHQLVLLTAQASGRGYYDPSDATENLLEYLGVLLAFLLSALVIWLLIRKELKQETRRRGETETRGSVDARTRGPDDETLER
jgi:hypothetical protein